MRKINLSKIKRNKKKKDCIKFYKENINTNEFKEYLTSENIERDKTHREYIKKEHPEWLKRIDYYDNYVISGIQIHDILSNKGIEKLLKKIYSLSKRKYSVKNYYKKPSFIQKYNYIHLQYTGSGYGRFAEIKFLNDKYIDSINISWVQINNYFALLEYEFKFKKLLDNSMYNDFILDNIDLINSKDYFKWYYIDNSRDVSEYYLALEQMYGELFPLICQHYITSVLYSEQGKNNQLINLTEMTRTEPIDIDTLYLGDITLSYHNKKDDFIIISDLKGINYKLIAGNNIIPHFSVCPYIAKYGNDFYYNFFGYWELKIFEQGFSKYISGEKKITYSKDFQKLLMKIQSTSEQENKSNEIFYEKFNEKWNFYISNDKTDLKKSHKNRINYRDIYKENFSYLQLLSEINYTKNTHNNAVVATIASIIATIIAILSLLY